MPYKRVYLHRVIAERTICRQLRKEEVVHHLNGNTDDNSPDNLEVCSSASVHRLHHRRSHSDNFQPDRPLERDGDLWF